MAIPVQPQAVPDIQELFRLVEQQQARSEQQQAQIAALMTERRIEQAFLQGQDAKITELSIGVRQQKVEGQITQIDHTNECLRNEHLRRIEGIFYSIIGMDAVKIVFKVGEKLGEKLGEKAAREVLKEAGEKIAGEAAKKGAEEFLKMLGEKLGEKAAEEVLKNVGEKAVGEVLKKVAEETLKKGGEEVVKKVGVKFVPGIGLIIGLGSAVRRCYLGHSWLMIGGEIASGVASTFSGVGTAISMGIDIFLLGGDLMKTDIPAAGAPAMSLVQAYSVFNLDPVVTDRVVKRTSIELIALFHNDAVGGPLDEHVGRRDIRAKILQARDIIFTARKLPLEEAGLND